MLGTCSGARGVGFHGVPEGAGQGFAQGLGFVVGAAAGQDFGVQVDFGFEGKGFQKVAHQVAGQGFHHGIVQSSFHYGIAAAAPIQGHHRQGFVQGNDGVAHPADAAHFAQGLVKGPTQQDGYILDQVMPADMGIPLGIEGQVKQAVPGNLADHVIQKAVAGVDLVLALAIEVDRHLDGGLGGFPLQRCLPGRGRVVLLDHRPYSATSSDKAATTASVSAGSPTLART